MSLRASAADETFRSAVSADKSFNSDATSEKSFHTADNSEKSFHSLSTKNIAFLSTISEDTIDKSVSSVASNEDTNTQKGVTDKVYTVYKRRWFVMSVVFLLNVSNGAVS